MKICFEEIKISYIEYVHTAFCAITVFLVIAKSRII